MSRLQDQRVWLVGGALAAVLLVAVSWLLFVGPQLSSAGDLSDQAAMSRQQNDALQAETDVLRAKSAKLPKYTSSLKAALASLPYDSGLPAFTRQLNAQGKASGVTVDSVVVGGVAPVAGAATGAAAAGTAPASAGAAAPAAPAATGAGGLFSLQVTVQSSGSLTQQLAFLRTVRTVGPRQALITAAQFTPSAGAKTQSINRSTSLTTQMTIFVAPQSPAQIRQLDKLARGDLDG